MRSQYNTTVQHRETLAALQEVPPSRVRITDGRILGEVRRLIASNKFGEGLAGYIRSGYSIIEHACVEPGCSCNFGVCGPFQDPPVRCTAFEQVLLPAFPDLERAYWAHLQGEPVAFTVRRCLHLRCRKRVRDDETAFCAWHTETRERQAKRELRLGRRRMLAAAGE